MHHLRKLVIVGATIFVLALGVFALVKSPVPQSGDVIIIKGGSLTIQCPLNDQCFNFNATAKKFEHKDKNKKVMQIVVKDESDKVIADLGSASFPNGKPSIEVHYK